MGKALLKLIAKTKRRTGAEEFGVAVSPWWLAPLLLSVLVEELVELIS